MSFFNNMTTLLDKSYTKYRLHLMLLTACIIHIKLIMHTYWLSTENSSVQNRILTETNVKVYAPSLDITVTDL